VYSHGERFDQRPFGIGDIIRQPVSQCLGHEKVRREATLPHPVLETDLRAQMVLSSLAEMAVAARYHGFDSYPVTSFQLCHLAAYLLHYT
jgi:hypothetical protein